MGTLKICLTMTLLVCLSPYKVPCSYGQIKLFPKMDCYAISIGLWLCKNVYGSLKVNIHDTGINNTCLQFNSSYCQSVVSCLLQLEMHPTCTFQLLLLLLLQFFRLSLCRPAISSLSLAAAGERSHEQELIRDRRQVVYTRAWTVSEFTEVSPTSFHVAQPTITSLP